MPRYIYRKPEAPAPAPITIDRKVERPSAEKLTRTSKPSTDKATQGVPRKSSDG